MRNPQPSNHHSSVINMLLFSGWFEEVCLCLYFSEVWLWCGTRFFFFKFILFEIHWTSWIYRFIHFVKSGRYSYSISSNTCFKKYSSGILMTQFRYCLISAPPHRSLVLCSYVTMIFLFFRSDHFCGSVFKFTDSSLRSVCYWLHERVFHFGYYTPVLTFPLSSSLYLLFLCWYFLPFHLFQDCYTYFLEHFIIIFNNFNICFISSLTSVDCLFSYLLRFSWFFIYWVIWG